MKAPLRQSIGRQGETLAARFLEGKGYSILEKNLRTPYGEIDIIARHGDTIVFVEVKTRTSRTLGPPEISITPRKAEHMRSAAEYYIQQHTEMNNDWRIDVLSVLIQPGMNSSLIDHFENVIS